MKKICLFILLVLITKPVFSQDTVSVALKEVKQLNSFKNKDYLDVDVEGLNINAVNEGNPELPSKIIQILVPFDKEIDTVFIAKPKIETIALDKKIAPFQGKIKCKTMIGRQR